MQLSKLLLVWKFWYGSGGGCSTTVGRLGAVERTIPFDDRRANRGAHVRLLSKQREHGTFLSQPAFAVAQFEHAIGVR